MVGGGVAGLWGLVSASGGHRRGWDACRRRLGGGSTRRWCRRGGRERADAQQLAEVVGEAGEEVFAGRAREAAQAEGGEAARLLELAEDRLDDGLAAGVASAGVRLPELEAHRAGGPTVLGLEHPVVFVGLEAGGAERALRAVRHRRDILVLAGTA